MTFRAVSALLAFALAARPQSAFDTARKLQADGRYAEAEKFYRIAVKANPRSIPALTNLGVVLAREGRYVEAIAAYKSALKLDNSAVAVKVNLAIAYIRTGNCGGAVPWLESVLRADEADRRSRQLLAMCQLETGRFAEAVNSWERLMPSDDPSVLLGTATAYIKVGRTQEALPMLERIQRESGDSPGVQLALGIASFGAGDFDAAEASFRKALLAEPANSEGHFYLGAVHFRRNNFEDAVHEWREAVKANPGDFAAVFALGALLSERREFGEARTLLTRALSMRPDTAAAQLELGRMELQAGNPALALPHLKAAARLASQSKTVSFLLATALRRAGQAEKAKAELARGRMLADEESVDLVGSALGRSRSGSSPRN